VRREDAMNEWRAVLAADPDNRAAKMYLALLDPKATADKGAADKVDKGNR